MSLTLNKHREPVAPWRKVYGVAGVVLLVLFAALELFWRSQGHTPGVSESIELWAYHRDRATGADRNTVVLLGASRMQIGFAHEAFLAEHPDTELVQLALPGRGPMATLRDLAEDESFRGTVLCAVEEISMQPNHNKPQDTYVSYYHKDWGPGKSVSLLLSTMLQERLAMLQPRLGGEQLALFLMRGELPLVNYTKTLFSRRRIDDYQLVDVQSLIRTRLRYNRTILAEHPPASPEVWADTCDEFGRLAKVIEDRGGAVVFLKFPLTGRMLALQDEFFPRDRYWEVFVERVGQEVLHYDDMPDVASLRLPDESHLNPRSAARFTRWVAQRVGELGVLD